MADKVRIIRVFISDCLCQNSNIVIFAYICKPFQNKFYMYSEFDITTAKWGDVKKSPGYDMAILPWGATEPHNGHLPYCTDVLTSQAIAFEVAAAVRAVGCNVMVLPGVPFGSQNPGQNDLPFCIHTSQATQFAILRDTVSSLDRQGIRKLLIINGHGGNSFKGFIRDLASEKPDFLIASSEWFAFIPRRDYFDADIDDHAGEQETSVMMHFYPELVKMEYASDGASRPFAVDGLNRKVAWVPRNWSIVTESTGIGDPSKASAEKGKAYVEAVVAEYVRLVEDICRKDLY